MQEPRTLTFVREKETKNTVRFQEEPAAGEPPVVGTLYVAKWYAGDAQRVVVTIARKA
jgi:hypothetical protein